jgi:hypothetical protein
MLVNIVRAKKRQKPDRPGKRGKGNLLPPPAQVALRAVEAAGHARRLDRVAAMRPVSTTEALGFTSW